MRLGEVLADQLLVTPLNAPTELTAPRVDPEGVPASSSATEVTGPAETGEASVERMNPGEPSISMGVRLRLVQSWISQFSHRILPKVRSILRPKRGSSVGALEVTGDGPAADSIPFANAVDFNPLPAEANDLAATSDEIFAEIGRQLRARREMLSLTYDEIERHTRVRASFLKALEEGALDDLPSPVQTRGILANYAAFLDLDSDTIMLRFADGLQARHREQRPRWPTRTRSPMTVHTSLPPLRSFIASDLVFGGGVAIMLLLFAIWGINRVMSVRSASAPRATAPSISEVLAGTPPAQEVTVIPAQASLLASTRVPTALPDAATVDPNVSVRLELAAAGRTYMRVTVDGKVQFEGRTEPGVRYSYQATQQVEVLAGNAAALQITHNGHDLGFMGSFGEVLDRLYTSEGVITPTSTLQPTRTPTPNITPTPSNTVTRTPTETLTPKPGG